MSEAWLKIWRSRTLRDESQVGLSDLIAADGFDTGQHAVNAEDWIENARRIHSSLKMSAHDSVFEVGCGAGAFLMALSQITPLRLGGIDFSPELIQIAKKALPGGEFDVCDAEALRSIPTFDHVIAHSVFHYLPMPTAEVVLSTMIKKARRSVAVLDLPDAATRSEAEALRRGNLPPGVYEARYSGLTHTYFDRDALCTLAEKVHPNARVTVTQSHIVHNPQSRFRFNLLLNVAD